MEQYELNCHPQWPDVKGCWLCLYCLQRDFWFWWKKNTRHFDGLQWNLKHKWITNSAGSFPKPCSHNETSLSCCCLFPFILITLVFLCLHPTGPNTLLAGAVPSLSHWAGGFQKANCCGRGWAEKWSQHAVQRHWGSCYSGGACGARDGLRGGLDCPASLREKSGQGAGAGPLGAGGG